MGTTVQKALERWESEGGAPAHAPDSASPHPDMAWASEHRTALSAARSHMANERTHMAGVRTSVALLSFGITLNRFSITLEEAHRLPPGHGTLLRDSANIGLGMVVLGIVILGMSLWRYMKVRHQISTMTYEPPRLSLFILTTLLILFGAASAIIMLTG
jgi:putative membrane protein